MTGEGEILTLYEHPFALYCQKVLVALNELGVGYDVLEEQRDFSRADLAKLWPRASIPMLRDGDEVIGETSITNSSPVTRSRSRTARPHPASSTRWQPIRGTSAPIRI